jgi:cytochrome c oxidase subunit 3
VTEIPYTVRPRPDTGFYNARLGIWLFLASEVMLFGALFSSYVLLRLGAAAWPHGYERLNILLGSVNTAILVASGLTMTMSRTSLASGRLQRFRRTMTLTVALGCVFLVIKGFEYAAEVGRGFVPGESTFMAVYFTLTGLHGLHVLGGIVVCCYMLGPGGTMWTTDPARFAHRADIAGLYWYFVDLVWIIIFPLLYLQ